MPFLFLQTALHFAAKANDMIMVKILAGTNKANVELRNHVSNHCTSNSSTYCSLWWCWFRWVHLCSCTLYSCIQFIIDIFDHFRLIMIFLINREPFFSYSCLKLIIIVWMMKCFCLCGLFWSLDSFHSSVLANVGHNASISPSLIIFVEVSWKWLLLRIEGDIWSSLRLVAFVSE